MRVYTFFERNFDDFISKLSKLKDNLDLGIFFIPPQVYLYKDSITTLYNILNPVKFVTLSAVGVMKDDKLEYGYFGGFGIKFERGGSSDILVVNNFSREDINYTADKIIHFLVADKDATYMIFSTSSNRELNMLLDIIFKDKGMLCRLYGGVASSNLDGFKTFVSVDNSIYEDSIIIIRLKKVLSYNTLSFGFIPVGTYYKITKAIQNQIFEIDGVSAEHFLFNLLNSTGIKPAQLDDKFISKVLWEFPLLLIDQERRYIKSIRTFKKFNSDSKAIEFYGLVEEGSLIKLSVGDSEDILKDVDIRGKEFYNMITYGKRKPELILNISCTARNYVLLSDNKHEDEQKIYYSYLNRFKLSGFLTFGEIGPDRFGKPGEFFNETSILVGLEEADGL